MHLIEISFNTFILKFSLCNSQCQFMFQYRWYKMRECSDFISDNCKTQIKAHTCICLLYTSDAADDMQCVDLGGRRIIKKKKKKQPHKKKKQKPIQKKKNKKKKKKKIFLYTNKKTYIQIQPQNINKEQQRNVQTSKIDNIIMEKFIYINKYIYIKQIYICIYMKEIREKRQSNE
eukprot:TRINITY_DN326_c0_g1_i4.p4 TRINITY_DN326_c0_g1~~TRINITY_DN326_c0_g1_i4.p4  ORF type:complete len:175 (-),score=31.68 TRINITY_DN326_c0_g1_i4:31-555(-)